ncbi:hypothetical protein Pmar_PMAR017201 [Perkinsus marinus ATCC 50983]|uniref:Uncharacterized protein n=1 Tax=Perkinsus marinus (strain ATCC 50983 / TXsc) TaxID=423536 RepID=C5LSU6_PERM5|nr:hypothetical protein Pmar_PMAR017201 [Perkinsus marinus ATCC 50983]EER00337.1 hypothetical protein Pmar_PMAR017201 [Perkinsus marinus ATCC 50983]|eukprot:XP_002767619.1 hypothetical protein Pmar_PMAR017201 [Perkinsus marinus ATCC 50983]
MAQPRFARAMLEVQSSVSAIGRIRMVKIEEEKCYDLSTFIAIQEKLGGIARFT